MTNLNPDREFAILCDLYLNGELDEEQTDRLLRRVRENPAASRTAYEYLRIDFLLRQKFKTDHRLESPSEAVERPERPEWFDSPDFDRLFAAFRREGSADMDALALRAAETALPEEKNSAPLRPAWNGTRSFLPMPILIPLMLILFGVMVFQEWTSLRKNEDSYDFGRGARPAVVLNTDEVAWIGDTRPPTPGEPLTPGALRFESGSVELLFASGVRGVVEGPADLLVIDEKQVFCRRGKWSVTVPEQGKGFEIQTPLWSIRDLGTKFYAAIDNENGAVRVLQGAVEVEKTASLNDDRGGKRLFRADEGADLREGRLHFLTFSDFDLFVTTEEMRRRSEAFRKRLRFGSASASALRAGALRHIDFNADPASQATVFGGTQTPGSTPEARAYRFAGPEDRIRLRPAGSPASMSAVLLLKIERLNSEMNPILMSDGTERNGLVWHVTRKGAMIVGVRSASGRQGKGIFETPVVVTDDRLGEWLRLALVVDGSKRRITAYFDGDPVFSETLAGTMRPNLDRVDVGCWRPSSGKGGVPRQLDGAIEQVLIFDRALNIDEIRTLEF